MNTSEFSPFRWLDAPPSPRGGVSFIWAAAHALIPRVLNRSNSASAKPPRSTVTKTHWGLQTWHSSVIGGRMLKLRMKRAAEQNARAMKRLRQVELSVAGLGDEDLLDLADIFKDMPGTAIAQYAFDEMARRKINL